MGSLETLLRQAERNPPFDAVYSLAIREHNSTDQGRLVCVSPKGDRGRPKETIIVEGNRDVDWRRMTRLDRALFKEAYQESLDHLASRHVFATDHSIIADPADAMSVRLFTPNPAASAFAYNMFRGPVAGEGFTLIHAPDLHLDPQKYGRTGMVALDPKTRTALVIGKEYLGLLKKAIFTLANYELPSRGVLPMHAAENVGLNGDVAIFFGLSGTGKTTLSAEDRRWLIGDDEHAWNSRGTANMEGGCYAKIIRLSRKKEQHIYDAIHHERAILENVVLLRGGILDFNDDSLTENTRASYPLNALKHYVENGMGGHPSTIFFLTADATGVLPPMAKLTTEQAVGYFVAGYTSKVAGTVDGVTEPQATFSLGYGDPFLPRTASTYANMFTEKLSQHPDVNVFLVNTGWNKNGERVPLEYTRNMVQAALDGKLENFQELVFGLNVPLNVPGVPQKIMDPRNAWPDSKAYGREARILAGKFEETLRGYGIDPGKLRIKA